MRVVEVSDDCGDVGAVRSPSSVGSRGLKLVPGTIDAQGLDAGEQALRVPHDFDVRERDGRAASSVWMSAGLRPWYPWIQVGRTVILRAA